MCKTHEVGLTEVTIGESKHYLCYPCMAVFATDVMNFAMMNLKQVTDNGGNTYFTDKE